MSFDVDTWNENELACVWLMDQYGWNGMVHILEMKWSKLDDSILFIYFASRDRRWMDQLCLLCNC